MKFSKQLVAAFVAAVLVGGSALATQNNRIIEAKKIITDQLVVGDQDFGVSGSGVVTFAGTVTGDDVTSVDDVTAGDDLVVTDDATIGDDLAVTGLATVGETLTVTGITTVAGGVLGPVPTAEVIVAAATITADACGGVKRISSASAVTTGTTNTFTAPAAGNAGCRMLVVNVNASDAITLDVNANFAAQDGANVVLAAGGTVAVQSDGTVWRQESAAIDPTA